MSSQLILLTGASGFVGYATLIQALSKGYHVRAAVRSELKAGIIKSAKPTQLYLPQLSFVTVPDFKKDGAFDEAIKGVDYVIHVASPLPGQPSTDFDNDIIQPSIRGTLGILESSLKEPNVKRVVITASIASVRPPNHEAFTADNIVPDPEGPYSNPFTAYIACKQLAYNRTRAFVAHHLPKFTVVNIMPSFVVGKNALASTKKEVDSGSNSFALSTLLGRDIPSSTPGSVCHIDDVAYVHVASLDPKIEGNRNFGVNSNVYGTVHWDAAIDIVKKHFPDAVKEGIFPFGGKGECYAYPFDTTETERTFGFKHKDYESMIVSLAGHYIDVARAEAKVS